MYVFNSSGLIQCCEISHTSVLKSSGSSEPTPSNGGDGREQEAHSQGLWNCPGSAQYAQKGLPAPTHQSINKAVEIFCKLYSWPGWKDKATKASG